MKQFQQLQDELHAASQELTVRTTEGLATLAKFIAGYLSLLEIEAQIAEEDADPLHPTDKDSELDEIRRFISGKSRTGLRQYSVGKFAEAQEKLASPATWRGPLNWSQRFGEELNKNSQNKLPYHKD